MAAPKYRVEAASVEQSDGQARITFTVLAWSPVTSIDASAFDLLDGARHAIGGNTTVIVNREAGIDSKAVARAVSDVIANERTSG